VATTDPDAYGKRFRRMNERQSAARDFAEAADEFRALGKTIQADAAARDLRALANTRGLPRWAWGAIVLFILCVAVAIIALTRYLSRYSSPLRQPG
jgi:hypothetical protein